MHDHKFGYIYMLCGSDCASDLMWAHHQLCVWSICALDHSPSIMSLASPVEAARPRDKPPSMCCLCADVAFELGMSNNLLTGTIPAEYQYLPVRVSHH